MISSENVISVESAPFRGHRSLFSLAFLLKLTKGIFQAIVILRSQRPRIVVGFGGHFSFPVVAAARLMGIKTMIHEQNVMPGFANKVLVRFVDAVALSFDQTRGHLPAHRNVRVTGNPIRASIEIHRREEALKFFGFQKTKATVLVLGGSQGSESINTVFLEALKILPPPMREKLQVLHLTGKMSTALAEENCARLGILTRAFSFFERMDLGYGAADFAIGRAGATFLAEAKAKGMPAILVPYPYAGGHQILNARAFLEDGRSRIIEQRELSSATLAPVLEEFIRRVFETSGPGREPRVNRNGINPREELMNFIEMCAGWDI